MEEWRDIQGYEGRYQVSNLGRVKSLERLDTIGRKVSDKILTQRKTKDGYIYVVLSDDGMNVFFLVHRLVVSAFLYNDSNYDEVNHMDENKENNSADNLEWCDRIYNSRYGTRNKRASDKMSKTVYQYDVCGNLIKEWTSAVEASKKLGIVRQSINKCCNNYLRTAGGYKWSYS